MTQEQARLLREQLEPGASLALALELLSTEIESRSMMLVGFELTHAEGLAKAQALQGEIRGGQLAVERLKDLINEYAISDR